MNSWDTLPNGELLRVAEEAGFDLLLTTDKNLAYQQNLKGRKIAILALGKRAMAQVTPICGPGDCRRNAATPGSYALTEIP